ncbi:MAG: hypothetical protein IJ826_10595 [Bacteroidaceae bacterium]|nr:hypothetical protein [Bacteroidaceae bacterium]
MNCQSILLLVLIVIVAGFALRQYLKKPHCSECEGCSCKCEDCHSTKKRQSAS